MSDIGKADDSPPPQGANRSLQDLDEYFTLERLKEILGTTIKQDDENKVITLLLMLLNYTEEDQQNIAFNAPSSSGKSYIAQQIAAYFPQEDVDYHSYTSPQAFYHELGKLTTLEGEPLMELYDYIDYKMRPWFEDNMEPFPRPQVSRWKKDRDAEIRRYKKEWNQIEKVYEVNLEKRILIFLDQPHDQLLQKLRALFSHDRKRLISHITDKTKEGGNRTKRVVIVGFPTPVFCSSSSMLDEQERTRFWMLSPEITSMKLRDSLKQQSEALGDRQSYRNRLESNPDRMALIMRINSVKALGIREILIKQEDREYLYNSFIEAHPRLSARHQRDFPHLIALAKSLALLNFPLKERDGTRIYAARDDIEQARCLMNGINEANELGLPPYIYRFWVEMLEPNLTENGLSKSEVRTLYHEFYNSRIGDRAYKAMVESLCEAGLTYEMVDPLDRRSMRLFAQRGGGADSIQIRKPPEPPLEPMMNQTELGGTIST